jgi:hypothetical protein
VPISPASDDIWIWSIWCNENWQGKQKYSEQTWPSTTLSTNPTSPDLGSKLDRWRLTAWATAVPTPTPTPGISRTPYKLKCNQLHGRESDWDNDTRSTIQEIALSKGRFSPNVHYRIHNSSPITAAPTKWIHSAPSYPIQDLF